MIIRKRNKMNIKDIYNKYSSQRDKFDLIENKFSNRPLIHALILLDHIYPNSNSDNDNIRFFASDGDIFLTIDRDKLEKVITEEQVIDLIRCGLGYYKGNFYI